METGTLITNQIECFATLFKNPFLLAPLLPTFYKELGEKERSVLLAYLVLPLVLPENSRAALVKANSRSSLRTFVTKRECLYGLGRRISDQRPITNTVLQHNFDMKLLSIPEEATIKANEASIPPGICRPDMLRAARRLGIICRPFSVPVIFLQFGIKNL